MFHIFTCHLKDREVKLNIMMARVIVRNSTIILGRVIKVKCYISGPQQGLILSPKGLLSKSGDNFICVNTGDMGEMLLASSG